MGPHRSQSLPLKGLHYRHPQSYAAARSAHRPSMTPVLPRLRTQLTWRELGALKVEVEAFNNEGKLSHYDRLSQSYVIFNRKQHGVENLQAAIDQGFVETPHCGHAADPNIALDTTVMKVFRKTRNDPDKSVTGFLQATSHQCDFISMIPSLNRPKVTAQDDFEEPSEDELDEQNLQTALAASRRPAYRGSDETSPSSSQSSVSVSSASSFFGGGDVHHIAFPDPRASNALTSGDKVPKHQSLYTREEAIERQQIDKAMIDSVFDSYKDKVYLQQPHVHPAFDTETLTSTHVALQRYHPQMPDVVLPKHADIAALYSDPVGVILAHLNSTVGVRSEVLKLLLQFQVTCPICECAFSPLGFKAHSFKLDDDNLHFCGNTPDGYYSASIPDLSRMIQELRSQDFKLRTYPVGYLPRPVDFLANSALGLAWFSWHSRAGLTQDAWALISTGWQYCDRCCLVHTFVGHAAHCNADGECNDPGERQFSDRPESDSSGFDSA
ncbi:hypothetical protein C8J56DRAFT_1157389 [Mycena floridula]|nr:hypothetical protein C8J56DRAFT_1157389 [Mycena floridula]